jgi:SAM-dependent methyltransferase
MSTVHIAASLCLPPEPNYAGMMMTTMMNAVRPRLRRARLSLKGFAYSGPGRDRWQQPDRVIEALPVTPGQRVADLGAGGGYFTFRISRAVGADGRVYAVDTDPDMRSLIADRVEREKWGNVVPVAIEPDDPTLPEPVDLILLVNAFHHLPEPATYLPRLATGLRPGGRVAVIEARPKWFLFGHATEPAEIRSAMAAAGYRLVDEHEFLSRQSFLTFQRDHRAGDRVR